MNNKKTKLNLNQSIEGVVKRHPDGYGFFIANDPTVPDIYIAKHSMHGVMSNDRVLIRPQKDGARWRGEVINITERQTKKVSGQLKKLNPSQGLLRDESFAWGEDLKVSWAPQAQVKDQDWVVVKITSYPDSVRGFQGQLEAVIGDISNPKNDNIRVLASHSIPNQFSKATIQDAQSLPKEVSEQEMRGRKDLRNKKFITIDGKTAKDFDDAIYVERVGQGYKLWVAIADVSHYVRSNRPIDKDAYERGTSTYFPNFVSPMLPEELSNELCSLKPNVVRLAMVAEMDFNSNGDKTGSQFYEASIKSQARVTYGEAQEVLEGATPSQLKHVQENIKLAGELSKILMDRRFQKGSLNLEIPESVIELDAAGVPVDIIKSDRLFAHRLIEELMLAANVAVAEFLKIKNTPALYRVHAPPKQEALDTLERFLNNFGYSKKLGASHLQMRITQALQKFSGEPQEPIINMLTLRSMNQAKYSPENIGHFGLGFANYAHFTSPIRRYPDLVIHRLLKATLGVKGYQKIQMRDLETYGTMLSACEQRSVKAERQVQSIKKARFLEKHLGEEFDGMITSVTKFGVFVSLRQFDVDGLVRLEELGNDRFEFDEEQLQLIGKRSGRTYSLGDAIRVQVAACDHQIGRIDFAAVKSEELTDATQEKIQSNKKRRTSQDNSGSVRQARVSRHHRKNKAAPSQRSGKTGPRRHK